MLDPNKIAKTLVDRHNLHEVLSKLEPLLAKTQLLGFDIETHDALRHQGLNELMKIDENGKKAASTKLIFDTNRTTITGFSLYPDGTNESYYFNLAHADAENCISFEQVRPLLDAYAGYYVIHNAPYEIVMLEKGLNTKWKLPHGRVIDTLILCVTAYNSDTYTKSEFAKRQLTGLYSLLPDIMVAYGSQDVERQEDLVNKFCAKESDATHSYNGFVKDIAWGFNLKKASKHWLDYTQTTFEEVMNGRGHMGQLTGAEVVKYGADDAITCVGIYHEVMAWLMSENPKAIKTFFEQENPCCWVYAQMNATGMRVDVEAIYRAREEQRTAYAIALRDMKAILAEGLTKVWSGQPSAQLTKYEKWYEKGRERYLSLIKQFVDLPDTLSDYDLVNYGVRSPVGKGWSGEEANAINLSHYMPMRVILFEIFGLKAMVEAKKVQSDGEARDKLKAKAQEAGNELVVKLLDCYQELEGISQSIKLYINNYVKLVDPDTGRMYPTIGSILDTRRMSMSTPNPQQLTKFGKSKFVRSFFLPDDENSVIIAPDFSAIELMIIGGYSDDAAFLRAYGQRPHADLHSQTAAFMTGLSLEEFNQLPNKKQLRNEIGKPSGFGYFYSGSLSTVGKPLGWDKEKIREMTDLFRAGYAEAEQWRLDTISEAKQKGYVGLPDHLRRYCFESTPMWAQLMQSKFDKLGVGEFGKQCIRRIQNRAGNKVVNSRVQGLCATYVKRKLYRAMFNDIPRLGLNARVMFPCHDEVICSVHRDDVFKFKDYIYGLMIESEGIFNNVMIDSSMAMGRNYLAFNAEKNPKGLVELMEIDKNLPCISESRWGQRATEEETGLILDYMFS